MCVQAEPAPWVPRAPPTKPPETRDAGAIKASGVGCLESFDWGCCLCCGGCCALLTPHNFASHATNGPASEPRLREHGRARRAPTTGAPPASLRQLPPQAANQQVQGCTVGNENGSVSASPCRVAPLTTMPPPLPEPAGQCCMRLVHIAFFIFFAHCISNSRRLPWLSRRPHCCWRHPQTPCVSAARPGSRSAQRSPAGRPGWAGCAPGRLQGEGAGRRAGKGGRRAARVRGAQVEAAGPHPTRLRAPRAPHPHKRCHASHPGRAPTHARTHCARIL